MKQREPRIPVLIRARMRSGARWGDVSILNISSKGMLIHAADVPARGAYLEVRRGRHAIIARVVWTSDRRFGVCTQDRLSVEAIIREPDQSAPEARRPVGDVLPVERRSPARCPSRERHERSRLAGRAFEFVCIAMAGAGAALFGFGLIEQTLARPLGQVTAAIAPR